ncbi:uncharacterized protein N0V89_004728 [Didymosphaeria variabile]|uniref:Uncharacterized protein n=1 Tax=Didymosphaeria variabile TaxID=1932322 RepID=A0A9W8XQY0_9PLEO|nr:uncharacterized protein N0V89_004728 [Didymosphaeria variabile]KAJ4356692.1 hypothetical protein N0V89_004728 [Didymosphaeria variabile]
MALWHPTPTDVTPEALGDPPEFLERSDGDFTYPELLQLSDECTPAEFHDALARKVPFNLKELDSRLATELVQWLYEHMDLGLTAFGTNGVHFMTPGMPGVVLGGPEAPCNFPTLRVRHLQKVLDTDLFGVGITPGDCKLRALSVLVDYSTTYGSNITWVRTIPFKETLPCAALDTLLARVVAQPKTSNFKLQIFAMAWCMKRDQSHTLTELTAKVHDVSADAELLVPDMEAKSVYLEYLLNQHHYYDSFRLLNAYGTEDLPRAAGWSAGHWEVGLQPRFETWDEWHRNQLSANTQ